MVVRRRDRRSLRPCPRGRAGPSAKTNDCEGPTRVYERVVQFDIPIPRADRLGLSDAPLSKRGNLAGLIDGSVDVAPSAGHLHLGLVREPTIADRVSARSGSVREEWGEMLDPPVDGDVIDLDPAFTEEFLDVAVGEPIPEIPADGEDDDLRREPDPTNAKRWIAGIGRKRRGLIPPPLPQSRRSANATAPC